MDTDAFYLDELRQNKKSMIKLGGMALTLIAGIGIAALFKEDNDMNLSLAKLISLTCGLAMFCFYYVYRISVYSKVRIHFGNKITNSSTLSNFDWPALAMDEHSLRRFTFAIRWAPVVILLVIWVALITT